MSSVGPKARSFRRINTADLRRLASIASRDRHAFFHSNPQWAELYSSRAVCIALCQGAALHYANRKTGINDFDVYTFYRTHPRRHVYAKRKKYYDYGIAKFGKSVDKPQFKGRRVDCLMRDIEVRDGEDAATALQRYLRSGKTKTARLLAEKAVVLLKPRCGKIVWPMTQS